MAKKKKSDSGDDLDTGFNPKYAKLLGDWMSSADSYDTDELKKTIVDTQKAISDTEKDLEADERLNALKEEIKELSSAYRDVAKREQAKSMYCVHILRTRGEK